MNTNSIILESWINKTRIECMQQIRERLASDLKKNGMVLGTLDLILREDCKPLLLPDCETYRLDGVAWNRDKSKKVSFKKEFVGKIGMETSIDDLEELIIDLGTDIMLNLAKDDGDAKP